MSLLQVFAACSGWMIYALLQEYRHRKTLRELREFVDGVLDENRALRRRLGE